MTNTVTRDLIIKHEGVRHKVYLDSLGIPTIGVGFNLRRADAATRLKQVGSDLKSCLDGTPLTDDQIYMLLDLDLIDCETDLKKLFGGDQAWSNLPPVAATVLMDLRFNLGLKTLLTFKHTLADFKAGHFSLAADKLEKSLWYRQVGRRGKEDCDLLRKIGT